MKTLLILPFFLLHLVTLVASTDDLIKIVFLNGAIYEFEKSNIRLFNEDRLLISLAPLPKPYYYEYEFEGCKAIMKVDSNHLLLYSFLKGAYPLKIKVLPTHPSFQETHLTITVNNSFLKSWAFLPIMISYLILLFSIALAGILFFNKRNREKLRNLRIDWTNQLHNDIGGDLSSVERRIEILKKKLSDVDPKVAENVNKTFLILNDIQRKLRFVFNLVDPKKDSLQVMFIGIYEYAKDNSVLGNINFIYQNDIESTESFKIDIARINKLYLVLKEALNNVFKSAKASELSFLVSGQKEGMMIEIKDNGIGFDPYKTYNGNGLKNLRQYAAEGLMNLEIQSQVGNGTTIKFFVHVW